MGAATQTAEVVVVVVVEAWNDESVNVSPRSSKQMQTISPRAR